MDNNQDRENKSPSPPPVLHDDIQVKIENDYDNEASAILLPFIKKEEESDHDDDKHILEIITSGSKRQKINDKKKNSVADVEKTCPKCSEKLSSARLMAQHRKRCRENNANRNLPEFTVDLDDLDKELGPLDDDEDEDDEKSNGDDLLAINPSTEGDRVGDQETDEES